MFCSISPYFSSSFSKKSRCSFSNFINKFVRFNSNLGSGLVGDSTFPTNSVSKFGIFPLETDPAEGSRSRLRFCEISNLSNDVR